MSPSNELRIYLLNNVRLEWKGRAHKLAGLPKNPSLLAFLLLHRGALLDREQVGFTFWPDETEANARANLRRHLYDLKRALPSTQGIVHWFLSDAETVRWNPAAPLWLDVDAFEALERDGMLEQAAALYAGDLCQNLYDDWIQPERERLREKYISLLHRLIEAMERAQDERAALDYMGKLVRVDPLREETYRRWMRLMAAIGDRAGIVHAYNLCVTVLERELGVEPDADTRRLYEQLVQEQVERSVELRRPAQPGRPRNNVPQALARLIGREREAKEIRERLLEQRLVTLTGVGGVGKTRLALHTAEAFLPEMADGVWVLDLAGVREAEQLVLYLAQTLEMQERGSRQLRTVLLETLRHQQTLLVFDNCEQVIEAAAELCHTILTQCARVKILATSREVLGVPGEQVVSVAPLAVPAGGELDEPEAILATPSVQLLVTRAKAVLPTLHITSADAPALARSCRTLEGIPLALEFAAARLNVLNVNELADRLDEHLGFLSARNRLAPPRHQTLRATFEWSFALLTKPQQTLLTRLAVFGERFTLAAAEGVCGYAPLESSEIVTLLAMLIDKSLVQIEPGGDHSTRYRLLEVIRQFALEQGGDDIAQVRAHHVGFYLERVETAAAELQGPRQAQAYALLDADYMNIRAALESALRIGDDISLGRLCGVLWIYWWTRGYLTEGRSWLARALACSAALTPDARATLLNGAGRLAILQGDDDSARPLLQENLALRRELDDKEGIADALNSLGILYYHAEDLDVAMDAMRESMELYRSLGNDRAVARALNNLGDMTVTAGDLTRGMELLEEGLALYQKHPSPRGESFILINLGTAALRAGADMRAKEAFRASLVIKRTIQDQDGIAWTLEGLAVVAARENDLSRALHLMGAAEQQRTRIGTPTATFFMPLFAELRRQGLQALGSLEVAQVVARGRALSLEQAIALAMG